MEKKSSNPRDWYFEPLPKSYWESPKKPMVFLNPKVDNGSWDQSTYPDLIDTVFKPLEEKFGAGNIDEPMECHLEIRKNDLEDLCAALIGLGMERRKSSL